MSMENPNPRPYRPPLDNNTVTPLPRQKTLFPNLDGLRAFAILPVLGLHASYGILKGGFLGVDLFFVLSGFLITRLLFQELQQTHSIKIRYFYIRRALRLFPAMIASIVLAGVLWPFTAGPKGNLFAAALSVIFYVANFVDTPVLGSLATAWSLAIEEQFYLVWPILLLGLYTLFRGKKRFIAGCLVGVLLFVVIFRGWMHYYFPEAVDLYRFTLSRIDSLAAGAIAALFVCSRSTIKLWVYQAVVILVVPFYLVAIFVFSTTTACLFYGGFTFVAIIFACLIVALSQMPPTYLFSHPVLVWIGRRSYGLYIYHLSIVFALEAARVPKNNFNLLYVTALRLALTFLVAALSYRFLEKPFLNLKEQFACSEVQSYAPANDVAVSDEGSRVN